MNMAGTAITTTGQDITDNFRLAARKTAEPGGIATVLTSQGTGSTDWVTLCNIAPGDEPLFVLNPGTSAYKLAASVTGVVVEFVQ
jgi:hypothetical protein